MIKSVIFTNQSNKCASVLGPGTCDPRSELDSHSDMVVLGNHYFVSEKTGSTCNVQPFSKELGIVADVPIIDGSISYDWTYTKTTYMAADE